MCLMKPSYDIIKHCIFEMIIFKKWNEQVCEFFDEHAEYFPDGTYLEGMDAFKSGYEWISDVEKTCEEPFMMWKILPEYDRNRIIQRVSNVDYIKSGERDEIIIALAPRIIELEERIEALETLYEYYKTAIRERTFLE